MECSSSLIHFHRIAWVCFACLSVFDGCLLVSMMARCFCGHAKGALGALALQANRFARFAVFALDFARADNPGTLCRSWGCLSAQLSQNKHVPGVAHG